LEEEKNPGNPGRKLQSNVGHKQCGGLVHL